MSNSYATTVTFCEFLRISIVMTGRKFTDTQLIELIRNGGKDLEKAFLDLIRSEKTTQSIRRLVVGRGGSQEDYEEIFDDTLLELHKSILKERLEMRATISAYMYGIARNLMLRKFRNKKIKSSELDHDIEDSQNSAEDQIIQFEDRSNLLAIIGMLSKRCQEILRKAFLENFKNKDLQVLFGYTDGSIRKMKSKCLSKLKDIFKDNPSFEGMVRL